MQAVTVVILHAVAGVVEVHERALPLAIEGLKVESELFEQLTHLGVAAVL